MTKRLNEWTINENISGMGVCYFISTVCREYLTEYIMRENNFQTRMKNDFAE